jgi:polyhydroxyalkanoate synthesis regulator phasin
LPPASRKSGGVPEAVRRAVEKTVQSTLGTAGASRERAQELADDVLRRASVADRLRDAIQDLRTIGTAGEDIKELRAEVAALRRRVEQLEKKSGQKKKSKEH